MIGQSSGDFRACEPTCFASADPLPKPFARSSFPKGLPDIDQVHLLIIWGSFEIEDNMIYNNINCFLAAFPFASALRPRAASTNWTQVVLPIWDLHYSFIKETFHQSISLLPASRFPCCVLSYFSLVFVMEHSRQWELHIGGQLTNPSHKSQLSKAIN